MKRLLYLCVLWATFGGLSVAVAGPHDSNEDIHVDWTDYNSAFDGAELTTGQPTLLFFPAKGNGEELKFHTEYMQQLNEEFVFVMVPRSDLDTFKLWEISQQKNDPTLIFFDKHGNEFYRFTNTFSSRLIQPVAESMDKWVKDKLKECERILEKAKRETDGGKGASQIKHLAKSKKMLKGYDVCKETEQLLSQLVNEALQELAEIENSDLSIADRLAAVNKFVTPYKGTEIEQAAAEAVKRLRELKQQETE